MSVPRTQDRIWHDVGLPAETVELRGEVRLAVEKAVAPHAAEIGQREEAADSFPWTAFRGLADEGVFAIPFGAEFGRGLQYPLLGTCTATEEIAYHSSSMAGETFRLEELYRDAKILEIFEGANEVLQWVIARQLIGRDGTG